jgi:hypothetical protein
LLIADPSLRAHAVTDEDDHAALDHTVLTFLSVRPSAALRSA